MARDYKRKHKKIPSSRAKRASMSWLRVVLGCCVGAVLTVAVFVQFILPQDFLRPSSQATTEKDAGKKPRFDFYNILPEMEVQVPAAKTPPKSTATAPKNDTAESVKESAPSQYRLQLASFKSYEEADRFKAQLAFWGIEAEIDTVSIKTAETWHRVRTVLYSTRVQAEDVQKQLEAEGIHSILLKESK